MKMMMLWLTILAPNMVKTLTPNCRDCANYEFMIAKRRHEIAEQTALERSLDNSEIVFVRSVMECSKHGDDFKQYCPTCIKICDLMDGRAC